jgi:Mn-containing catalase
MFMRIEKLQTELPAPKKRDPNAAAALQELLGGKYGEMSTLGNYLFQSFNFRSKSKLKPFYSLVASITAEELGHVELVSNGVAMLNAGPDLPEGEIGASGSRLLGVMPSTTLGRCRLSCERRSDGSTPAWPAMSRTRSGPSTFLSWSGETVWLGPVQTHESATCPRPACRKLATR